MRTTFIAKCNFVERRYPSAAQSFKLEKVASLIRKEVLEDVRE